MKPVLHQHGIPVHAPVDSELLRPYLKKYLDSECNCPVCGTAEFDTDEHTDGELHFSSPTTSSQNKKCPGCGSKWEDIYQICEALLVDVEFPVHSTVINLRRTSIDVYTFAPGHLWQVANRPGNKSLPGSYELSIKTEHGFKSIWVTVAEMAKWFCRPGDERLAFYEYDGFEVINPTMAVGFTTKACPTTWGFEFGVWDKMPALIKDLEGAGQLVIQPINVQSRAGADMEIDVPDIAKLYRYNKGNALLLEVALSDLGMGEAANCLQLGFDQREWL